MKLSKFGKKPMWRSVLAVSSIFLALSLGGTAVTNEWAGYINAVLGVSNTKVVTEENENEDTAYYKSDFKNYTEVLNNALSVSRQIQAEGTTLLRNENNALPLKKGANVTFLGYSSAEIALGGTGSGAGNAGERAYTLSKACAKDSRINMNPTMAAFYQENYDNKVGFIATSGWGGTTYNFRSQTKEANELNANTFTSKEKTSWNDYKDAGIFVLSRIGGEGNDLSTAANYLELTENEKSVLQELKNGPFSKRIVILNTMNTPAVGWLKEYNIDAVLHIGGPGEIGLDAIVDIMVGNINPSGKTNDTYAASSYSAPAMQNFGDFTYTNKDQINNPASQKYVMYNEGIYVGYRYYETRYEDTVLGKGNASSNAGVYASNGKWSYTDEVVYPFGYGLSYTSFSQTLTNVEWNGGKKATATVTVQNTGDKAGKDVVEVYVQAPYTVGGVEKSAVVLAGFAKTPVLESKQSVTLKVEIDMRNVASYDYTNYKTYIMDSGNYYFAIGNGAHDALNNVLAAKGKTTADGMDYNGNAKKAIMKTKNNFDATEFSLSENNTKITNQFGTADINYYLDGANEITYLSRSDWQATWPKNMTGFAATADMVKEANSYYTTNEEKAPSAYTKGSSDTSSIKSDTEKKYSLVMMHGAKFDDPIWEEILDQLSVAELLELSRQGRTGAMSVTLPATTAVDGPAGYGSKKFITDFMKLNDAEKETTDVNVCFYPCEVVIGQTWNVDLANQMGKAVGEEGLWGGGVGWYGPAANIHRTPYAGRNFEYYSEDGYLSGQYAEAVCNGVQSKGIIVYLKHFFTNDQETNRIGVCTFSNEQALREIYLRAFQAALESTGENDPCANGIMGAFNRLGMRWSGHFTELWRNVVRGEFGCTANITTDFGQNPTGLMEPQLAYEAGTTMFCTSGTSFVTYLDGMVEKDAKLYTNLREATHYILYNFANSAAINGLSSSAKIVTVRVWYENVLLGLTIVSATVLALSGAMVVLQAVSKKEEN